MDSQLLLKIYKEQAKMIYFYLKKNGCSHEDAEDIVQESYTKYIAYSSGVAADKALAYIFTISMNEFKKLLKKKGKEQVLSINEQHFWSNFMSEHDTESSVLNLEMNQEIELTLSRIKEVNRQLLLLKYELELSYKEIALLLGMKVETVRTYLFRARKEFQQMWRNLHGGIYMDEFTEDIFDEEKIKKAIKKGKIKTIITIVFISIIVFIVLNFINYAAYLYYSQSAFKKWDAYVRLSTPNGYISETVDTVGFLGGEGRYKVSKDMKIKSLVIEQKKYEFGIMPSYSISRGAGGSIGVTGEDWQFGYKENGWREMMFFHPNIAYKKYKDDEELINDMAGDKIYEVAVSFDKPYKQTELPLVILPEQTWFWINTYSDSQFESIEQEAEEYDWSSTFIGERDALGFSMNFPMYSTLQLDSGYENF